MKSRVRRRPAESAAFLLIAVPAFDFLAGRGVPSVWAAVLAFAASVIPAAISASR